VKEMALEKHEMSVEMVDNNPYSRLMAFKIFKTFRGELECLVCQ